MYCTQCGKKNDDGHAFCIYCGTPLEPQVESHVCPQCGKKNSDDSTFCVSCGAKLGEAGTAPMPKVDASVSSGAVFSAENQQPAPKMTSTTKGIIAAAAAVVLISVGVSGFFIMQGSGASSGDQPQPSAPQTTSQPEVITYDTEKDKAADTDADKAATSNDTTTDKTDKTDKAAKPETPAYTGDNQYIRANYDKDYIFPDSNARYLSDAEVAALTQQQCMIARNEIAARHGRQFKIAELQEYFNSKSWYSGTVSPETYDATAGSSLNDFENKNSAKISEYEKAKGWM